MYKFLQVLLMCIHKYDSSTYHKFYVYIYIVYNLKMFIFVLNVSKATGTVKAGRYLSYNALWVIQKLLLLLCAISLE